MHNEIFKKKYTLNSINNKKSKPTKKPLEIIEINTPSNSVEIERNNSVRNSIIVDTEIIKDIFKNIENYEYSANTVSTLLFPGIINTEIMSAIGLISNNELSHKRETILSELVNRYIANVKNNSNIRLKISIIEEQKEYIFNKLKKY